jgi:exopolyphosphatase/guanosine-5'-triphosphate,3'-diphosphate pyrophosphatase
MQRAVLVCQKFVAMANAYGAEEIIAAATSATREAKNQEDLLRLLRRDARLNVHVISGREEARLIYLGISSGVHLEDQ